MPVVAAIVDVDPFGRRATPGTGTAFLVLGAFVVAFLLIRTSARLTRSVPWWPGGVETESGLHVHHLGANSAGPCHDEVGLRGGPDLVSHVAEVEVARREIGAIDQREAPDASPGLPQFDPHAGPHVA